MEQRTRRTSNAPGGLLSRQLAGINSLLTKASQKSDAQRNQKPPIPPSQSMSTPDPGTDSTTNVPKTSGSETSHNEIEEMYSRLIRSRRVEPENKKTTATSSDTETPQLHLRGGRDADLGDDPKALLASMDRAQSTPPPDSTSDDDDDDDPSQMLAEIEGISERQTQEDIESDPRLMLAELDREPLSTRGNAPTDEHDLAELRRRLRDSFLLSHFGSDENKAPDVMVLISTRQNATNSKTSETDTGLPQKCIAYAIAMILESADCGWEVARGWTTYLYSSGLDGYPAQAAKNALVKRATQELDGIIQNVLDVEEGHRLAEEKDRLPCRLIISNLAAGAEEEDVRFFFRSFAYNIRDLKFLEKRDPIKRTKTVQLDMWTRNAAVTASYMHGSIFGLNLNIELAVGAEK